MQFVEAFESLGYKVDVPRQDWSAISDVGICMTIWKREVDWPSLVKDSRVHGSPIEIWGGKPGNRKRVLHAREAVARFDGYVDAILLSGLPGQGYEQATPWLSSERQGKRWRVTYIDDQGHIRLEAV